MKHWRVIVIVLTALAAVPVTFVEAAVAAPSPGVVASGFCTYRTGYLATSTQAAERINTYFVAGAVGSEIFHVGDPAHVRVHVAEDRHAGAGRERQEHGAGRLRRRRVATGDRVSRTAGRVLDECGEPDEHGYRRNPRRAGARGEGQPGLQRGLRDAGDRLLGPQFRRHGGHGARRRSAHTGTGGRTERPGHTAGA